MVRTRNGGRKAKQFALGIAEHLVADFGVGLHDGVFVVGKAPRLVEDRVWNAHLA